MLKGGVDCPVRVPESLSPGSNHGSTPARGVVAHNTFYNFWKPNPIHHGDKPRGVYSQTAFRAQEG
jgi:hypothetical protein